MDKLVIEIHKHLQSNYPGIYTVHSDSMIRGPYINYSIYFQVSSMDDPIPFMFIYRPLRSSDTIYYEIFINQRRRIGLPHSGNSYIADIRQYWEGFVKNCLGSDLKYHIFCNG